MSRVFAPPTDAITASAAASINNLTEFTMLAWVKLTAFPALNDFANILNKVNPADGITGKAFYFNNVDLGGGAKNYLSAYFSSNVEVNAAISSVDMTSYTLNEWVHVAVSYSQSGNKQATIYVNGLPSPTSLYDYLQLGTASLDADAAYTFNAGAVGTFNPIEGKLSDCRYYNAVLTPTEIYNIYRNWYAYDPQPSHLKVQWTMRSNSASETDASGNGNTGTISSPSYSQDSPMKTVADAVTRAQNEMKGVTLGTTDALDFANEIYQIVGNAAMWDWRIATGTTFGTTANTQDYANVPSDFAALKQNSVFIKDDSSSINPLIPLDIRESLPKATQPFSRPRCISVENGNFRLQPTPNITRSGSGQWAVIFEYFKKPKRLTATSDTFEFDDAFFEVYAAGMIARVAQFLDDARAGQWMGRDRVSGKFAGTGLWGQFAVQLNMMIEQEQQASGQIIYAPKETLLRG